MAKLFSTRRGLIVAAIVAGVLLLLAVVMAIWIRWLLVPCGAPGGEERSTPCQRHTCGTLRRFASIWGPSGFGRGRSQCG